MKCMKEFSAGQSELTDFRRHSRKASKLIRNGALLMDSRRGIRHQLPPASAQFVYLPGSGMTVPVGAKGQCQQNRSHGWAWLVCGRNGARARVSERHRSRSQRNKHADYLLLRPQ